MLFNSHAFLFFFLPLALAGYYALPARWRSLWLVAMSYIFYGWWNWRYCGLLLLVTSIDYLSGARVAAASSPRVARCWLAISVAADLAILGFFKYYDLGATTANSLFRFFGCTSSPFPLLGLLLPVGISFYVFQSMSYSIDIYRGQARPARSFLDFAAYVSLFPQLVAGPIVRYRDMDSQLRDRSHTSAKAAVGVTLFVLGLAKKVLLADGVAPLADAAFASPTPPLAAAWSGLLAYTLQIYFDFSGYSDMAVGLGLLLGFQFPINFDSPYKSRSITEFWRRWHISLSSWLRDYLYIPLGGNRCGPARTYFNLWLTMLLGGLWHGASWTFLCWGAWHGLWLALERAHGKRAWFDRVPGVVQVCCTLLLVMLGWVFFRAPDFVAAGRYLLGLFGYNGLGLLPAPGETPLMTWLVLALALVLALFAPNSWQLSKKPTLPFAVAIALLFGLCVTVLLANASSPFLYFQF